MAYTFTIHHITPIAQDTVELGLTADQPFHFVAGQYIRLTLESIDTGNIKDSYREFSISSAPTDPVITTAFRVSDSLFKQQLLRMPTGATITTDGPLGVFTLPDDAGQPIVMIAGGVGITPFMSMLRDDQYDSYQIRLYYFNSSPERVAYAHEVAAFGAQPHREVRMVYDVVSAATLTELPGNARFYIAGPPEMVTKTKQALTDSGILMSNIVIEEFTGY